MNATEIGINSNTLAEINDYAKSVLKFTSIQHDDEPMKIIEIINDFVDMWQSKREIVDHVKLFDICLGLGAAWGNAICKELGWEWTQISVNQQDYFVVSPADRSYAFNPTHNFIALLTNSDRDNCSLLVVNMIKAGQLPNAKPGEFRAISF